MHRSTITTAIFALLLGACADEPGDMGPGSSSGAPESSGSDVGSTPGSTAPESSSGEGGATGSTGSTAVDDTVGDSTDGEGTSSGSSSGSSDETGIGDCQPLLVEVLYDALEADDELQWVKLYNPCNAAIDLSSYSIGYGGLDYVPDIDPPFGVKTLVGSVAADGCYVVGGPTSAAGNGDPDFEYDEDFAPNLELGQRVGAGVALFDVAADAVDTSLVPIDAVIYGPNNDNGLIDASGAPAPAPNVGNSVAGGSIQRTDLAGNWITAELPTPGVCPPF
jgi:hypothetical protein